VLTLLHVIVLNLIQLKTFGTTTTTTTTTTIIIIKIYEI
jgi:hypothetical protein